MPQIELHQKKLMLQLIKDQGLTYKHFFIRDEVQKMSYEMNWLRNLDYKFSLFYSQEYTAGLINYKMKTGGKDYNQHVIRVEEIEQCFATWIQLIKNQMEFDEEMNPEIEYSTVINNISSNFHVIYNQALNAEYYLLNEICGMGFRKAFEFLIKDYLIYLGKMTIDEAKKEIRLQKCIDFLDENYIIQKLATHIGYLGNDFSHYYRKWEKKDIKDLKEMINLLVDWIETTETYKIKTSMIETKSELINNKF